MGVGKDLKFETILRRKDHIEIVELKSYEKKGLYIERGRKEEERER